MSLIGIDLGTTHCKVAAYSDDGVQLALVRTHTPTQSPRPGWAEHPAGVLWEEIRNGIAGVREEAERRGGPVRAVGVAGMAEAGLLVAQDGSALTDLHAWHDKRTAAYVGAWLGEDSGKAAFRHSGVLPSTKCPLIKLQWLKAHEPAAFGRAWKWLHAPDYIAFRLTGEAGTDYSLATRTLAFDLFGRRWSERHAERAGVDLSLWPRLGAGTRPVGTLGRRAAGETGLPEGIPVVVAGHDHLCGAAAAGALSPGETVDSLGTAESVIRVIEEVPVEAMDPRGYSFGWHVTGEHPYVLGGFSGAGASIEWWIDRFESALAHVPGEERYDRLLHVLSSVKPGPTGIVYIPYLRGSSPPRKDAAAQGALFGVSDSIDAGTWLKGILEGLACEFRSVVEQMPYGSAGQSVRVIGGGTRNPVWMRLKAALLGEALVVPAVEEAVAQGAAMLAAVGAGLYPDVRAAAAVWVREAARVEPDLEEARAYDRWYREVYRVAQELYWRVEEARRA